MAFMGTVGADLGSFSSTEDPIPAGPYNTGGTLYVLIDSNYAGVRGYHATQLVELRRLIAKSGPQVQGAGRKWYAPGLRPTEQYVLHVFGLVKISQMTASQQVHHIRLFSNNQFIP